jgi:hypothetical protein
MILGYYDIVFHAQYPDIPISQYPISQYPDIRSHTFIAIFSSTILGLTFADRYSSARRIIPRRDKSCGTVVSFLIFRNSFSDDWCWIRSLRPYATSKRSRRIPCQTSIIRRAILTASWPAVLGPSASAIDANLLFMS